jgi:hypothetical protein
VTDERLMEEITEAILNGTLFRVMIKGKIPRGFPRGELLCCPADDVRTYLVCPIKVANWIYKRRQQENQDSCN